MVEKGVYKLDDILKVVITPEMVQEAREDQEWLNTSKGGEETTTKSNHNIIGSLAHQIVEIKLREYKVPFITTRREKYCKGDDFDIKYENDLLDIKGHEGFLNEKYFYNQELLVFQRQIDDPKFKKITYLVFCLIDPGYEVGYILGVIHTADFEDKSYPVKLRFDNQAIKSRDLKPFSDYVWRIWG